MHLTSSFLLKCSGNLYFTAIDLCNINVPARGEISLNKKRLNGLSTKPSIVFLQYKRCLFPTNNLKLAQKHFIEE